MVPLAKGLIVSLAMILSVGTRFLLPKVSKETISLMPALAARAAVWLDAGILGLVSH